MRENFWKTLSLKACSWSPEEWRPREHQAALLKGKERDGLFAVKTPVFFLRSALRS